ncbi:hypothetical protein B0H11DRAFT_1930488 [Mycena galericulata]|nr:hypothetical protein B0H11DRAFT_1930488 [Mycena galericulata]
MLSLLLMFVFATLLSAAYCGAEGTSSPAARLTPLRPFIQRPRETVIRGLLVFRQSPSCEAGFNVCNKTGCCMPEDNCCDGGGCCSAEYDGDPHPALNKAHSVMGQGAVQTERPVLDQASNVPLVLKLVRMTMLVAGGVSSSRTGSSATGSATSSTAKSGSSTVASTPSSASVSSSGLATSAGTARTGSSSSPPSTSTRTSIPVGGIAGVIIGGVLMLTAAVGMLVFCRRRAGRHQRLPDDLAQYSPTNQQHGSQYAPYRGSSHLHSVVTRLPSGVVMILPGGFSDHEPLSPAPAFPIASTERARTDSELHHALQMEIERQTQEINREPEDLTQGDSASRSIATVASRGDSDEWREIKMMEDQIRAPRQREAPEVTPWAQGSMNDEPPGYSSF